MYWFLLFQVTGLVVLITLVVLYAKFKKEEFWPLFADKFKTLLIAWGVIVVGISIACYRPLYYTLDCQIRSMSMKADTKYSWWLGECQIKTKEGVYVPISRSRALPGGKDGDLEQQICILKTLFV